MPTVSVDAIEGFKIQLAADGEDVVRANLTKENYYNKPYDQVARDWLASQQDTRDQKARERRMERSARSATTAAWVSSAAAVFAIIISALSFFM